MTPLGPARALAMSLLACLALAGPGLAQSARVKSGEHRDFTRLVVMLPKPANWQFDALTTGYALSLEGEGTSFDLSSAFDRINRKRVQSLRGAPGMLRLNEGADCDCHADAFEFRPGIIVIDVRDGKAPARSQTRPAAPPRRPDARAALVLTTPRPPLPPSTVVRSEVLGRLARSIAQEENVSLAARPENVEPGTEPLAPTDRTGGNRLQGGSCGEVFDSDPALWLPPGGDFSTTLALTRSRLYDDRDVISAPQALAVARLYMAAGFGAEARQLLNVLPAPNAETAHLAAIAGLIDAPGTASPHFAGMETCPSRNALWAVLARDHLRPSEPVARADIVLAFLQLPDPLKPVLFKDIAARLAEAGHMAEVARLRKDMNRLMPDTSAPRPDEGIAGAEIIGIYRDDTHLRTPDEATALALLADRALASGASVPQADLENMEAILNQTPSENQRAALVRAIALAHAQGGRFAVAFRWAKGNPPLRSEVLAMLAETGGDDDMLVFATRPTDLETMPSATTNRLAERFGKLGFPDEAAYWAGLSKLNGAAPKAKSPITILRSAPVQAASGMDLPPTAAAPPPAPEAAKPAEPAIGTLPAPDSLAAARMIADSSTRLLQELHELTR